MADELRRDFSQMSRGKPILDPVDVEQALRSYGAGGDLTRTTTYGYLMPGASDNENGPIGEVDFEEFVRLVNLHISDATRV